MAGGSLGCERVKKRWVLGWGTGGGAELGSKSDVRIEKPRCVPSRPVAKGIDGLLGAAQGERNGGFFEEEPHNGGALRRRCQ